MIFDLPLYAQYIIFIKSIGVGFLCGVLYGIPEAFLKKKNRIILAVKDILFFIAAGVISFLFVLDANFGTVRFYILAGELIGAALYFIFPYKALNAFAGMIGSKCAKIFSFVDKKLLHK